MLIYKDDNNCCRIYGVQAQQLKIAISITSFDIVEACTKLSIRLLSSSSIDVWDWKCMVRYIMFVLLDGIYYHIDRCHGFAGDEVELMNDEHEFHEVITYSI